jgi:hypothetical protein
MTTEPEKRVYYKIYGYTKEYKTVERAKKSNLYHPDNHGWGNKIIKVTEEVVE